ncbi:hypothetical protein QBC36DRAFT_199393, partial [Triangularia setosa]
RTVSLYLLIAVAGILTAPHAEPDTAQLEARATCSYASICSVFWSGICEGYCGGRSFSYMTGDGYKGLGAKK